MEKNAVAEEIQKKYAKELNTPGAYMEVKKTDLEDLIREINTLLASKTVNEKHRSVEDISGVDAGWPL